MLDPNSESPDHYPVLTYIGVGIIVVCAGLLVLFMAINSNPESSKQEAASQEAEARQAAAREAAIREAAAREAAKTLTVDKEDQSPEQVWLVADRDKRTWEKKVISTQLGNIRCMVFSPDGRQLAAHPDVQLARPFAGRPGPQYAFHGGSPVFREWFVVYFLHKRQAARKL